MNRTSNNNIEEDKKISRCACGEWIYSGVACQVCKDRWKAY